MENLKIKSIKARQILDSRGNPTVEADVTLTSGEMGRAAVPSGASTGAYEAVELRDGDKAKYGGKSVLKAVEHVNNEISQALVGQSPEQENIDKIMLELDGTDNKGSLGANALLAVSLATAKAVAKAKNVPFYQYVAELGGTADKMSLPMPMINVINGGEHAAWSTDFQEYMIVPKGAKTFAGAMQMAAEVFQSLKKVLAKKDYATTVGDEGGFAPRFVDGNTEPLECIKAAVEQAGYKFGEDIVIAMDIASSEFADGDGYTLKTNGEKKSTTDMVKWYEEINAKYPIFSIEDGLGEDDWAGWKEMTAELGEKLQLVGDDLFVTNTKLLQKGIDEGVANAILIKPNQIGTLTETIAAVNLAKKSGYNTVISHRSGETEDTSIAHIAVGLGAGQIKTGSMSRTDRICKYNELMRIEEANSELKLEQI